MHEVTATRACPLKTFDECIIGDNQINLPEGSNAKEYVLAHYMWESIINKMSVDLKKLIK